ncbi:MAG: TauD/TfdA family dioxygenase, partial [Oscillatoria sp. PMC 1076.18]|nr:TauD/TfdA family dioxygenase [Oscillatoria sp. PMC 1076.18]
AWQQIYQTDDFSTVEEVCQANNLRLQVNSDNSITTEYICPAVVETRNAKEQTFLNNILPVVAQEKQGQKASLVRLEDNSVIPEEVIEEIQAVTEKLTYLVNWQRGDIVMLDNCRLMHGRKAFADTQRDIYVRLTNPAFN